MATVAHSVPACLRYLKSVADSLLAPPTFSPPPQAIGCAALHDTPTAQNSNFAKEPGFLTVSLKWKVNIKGGGEVEDESRDVRLSKSLSYALRHGAYKMGLHLSSDGFIFVDEMLSHQQFSSFSLEDIERVVATNDKQRFKLQSHPETGRLQIRANQGHSVQVENLELRAVRLDAPDCPREAIHGSYMKHWASIRSRGLNRMNRTHIHLAPGMLGESQVISGMRQNCDLAVYVDVLKALSDGIKFYWSENGVLLTPGDSEGLLAPRYFARALRLKPTSCSLELE